jgi:Uma2 family endonuclease
MSTITKESGITPARQTRPRVRIGPGSAGRLMTPEQFDALHPDQFVRGYRYEVINGVLVVSPRPGIGERSPNDELGYLLRLYRDTPPHRAIIDDTAPEQIVATTNRRHADRVIWIGLGRVPDPEKDVPSVAIEFVSKRRRDALRDYEVKRDEYLAAGVQQYWTIDRYRRIMTVYRRDALGLTYEVIKEGESYETDLLPGFVLPLSKLLDQADRYERPKKPKKTPPKRPRKPKPPAGGTDG